MSASSWRAALRIARRDAWRAKGRSLLVIALIGLPVFALAGADVIYRTWQLSPSEKITRQIGSATASLQWLGGQVHQSAIGDATQVNDAGAGAPPTTARLLSELPPGSRAIEVVYPPTVRIRTGSGIALGLLSGLDYTDPIAHGLVHQVGGRAPRSTSEVALTRSLAEAAGLRIGGTLHLIAPVRDLTVVGIVTDASSRTAETAYTVPAGVPPPPGSAAGGQLNWLVSTPTAVNWPRIQQLNGLGYVVQSRSVYLHPPAHVGLVQDGGSTRSAAAFASGALIAGMALLEIVLLAGPAFAVGARRQRHDLALLAAAGGNRAHLRNVVLAAGIVLGATAGMVSVVAGVGAAAIAVPILSRIADAVPGHFDVRPVELLALVLVGVLTALAAAVVPARGAARLDVLPTLAGRRGTVRTRKRVPAIGAGIAGAGVVLALGAVTATTNATVILAGVALSELGLIICTPALLGLAARIGGLLPVAGRIALRDAGRSRSAAAPAVAAVMASVIGAVAIVLGLSSTNDQDRRNYQPSLPMNATYVALAGQSSPTPEQIAAILRAKLSTTSVAIINQPADPCAEEVTAGSTCESTTVVVTLPANVDSHYRGGAFPVVLIDDGTGIQTLLGTTDPAAVAALRAGKAVTVDPTSVHDGQLTLTVDTSTIVNGTPSTSPPPDRTRDVTVPAVAVTAGFPAAQVILPPALATQLGLRSEPVAVLADAATAPTDREQQAVRGALTDLGASGYLSVETGYHDPAVWLLYVLVAVATFIAVGAAIIATALTNADGRPDLTTLAAIGASPRTRRLLSLWRAGVISGIGTALGALAGFVVALAWIHSAHRSPSFGLSGGGYFTAGHAVPALRLVVPVLPVLATVAGIPVVAALLAFATTRSRLPSERPAE